MVSANARIYPNILVDAMIEYEVHTFFVYRGFIFVVTQALHLGFQ